MKKITAFSALSVVLAVPTAKVNATDMVGYFKSLSPYALTCESMLPDRGHLALEVIPGALVVKLRDAKGEEFSFPITAVSSGPTTAYNRYGNTVEEPYVAAVTFRDNGGHERGIMRGDREDFSKGVQ